MGFSGLEVPLSVPTQKSCREAPVRSLCPASPRGDVLHNLLQCHFVTQGPPRQPVHSCMDPRPSDPALAHPWPPDLCFYHFFTLKLHTEPHREALRGSACCTQRDFRERHQSPLLAAQRCPGRALRVCGPTPGPLRRRRPGMFPVWGRHGHSCRAHCCAVFWSCFNYVGGNVVGSPPHWLTVHGRGRCAATAAA